MQRLEQSVDFRDYFAAERVAVHVNQIVFPVGEEKHFRGCFRLRCLLCKRFALRNSENNSTNFIKLFMNILGVSNDSDFGLSDLIESFVAESSLSSIKKKQ